MGSDSQAVMQQLAATLDELRGEDAALLSMRFIHAFGYGELGEVLGVAESTARVRVHRALARARQAAGREDLDDAAMGALLIGVPAFPVSDAQVQAAVSQALRAARRVGAPGPRWPAGRTLRLVAPALAALLVAGLTVTAWRAFSAEDVGLQRSERVSMASRRPTLQGRNPDRGTGEATSAGGERTHEAGHATNRKASPSPARPVRNRDSEQDLAKTEVRLEVLQANGRKDELELHRVSQRGREFTGRGLRENPDLLRTRPGWYLAVETVDERAAMKSITILVPDPVPPLISIVLPARDDPRLARLELLVVDEVTGLPIPDAVLHWGEGASGVATQAADAEGRIVVTSPADDPRRPALWHFANSEHYVHAPGYAGQGWAAGVRAFLPSVRARALASWMESGTQVIALRPLPEAPGSEEHGIQLLDAGGTPVADAYVHVTYPTKGHFEPLQKGGGRTAGFLRTDETGSVRFPLRDVVGIELRKDRVLLRAWALAKEAWPTLGPRVLRQPPIAPLELTIEGLPEIVACFWTRDPLGAKRQPADGPCLTPIMDAAAERFLAAHGAQLLICQRDGAGGGLEPPRATICVTLAGDRAHTLYVHAGSERRRWTTPPLGAGPAKRTCAWQDLEAVGRPAR